MAESQVLYRKYRPQSFSEVKGQDYIVSILVESLLLNKVAHAYLFSGPRGCGKTTVARLMAKAVNCENFLTKHDICNDCVYCQSINSGNNIDITEMDAASNRGIDDIRSLKDTINFMPSFLKKKIYIIDEAHMLSKDAFNALLKTLEEPPEHVVFVLATTEAHKLPVTILSRLMRFDFRFGGEDEIVSKLNLISNSEGYKVDKGSLKMIYRLSGGSFRDAESLLGKVLISSSEKNIANEQITQLLGISSESEINNLTDYLLTGQVKALVESMEVLLNSQNNSAILLDQILSNIERRIIQSISDTQKIDELNKLAYELIQLKQDLRDFSDKKLILRIELVRIASRSGSLKPEVGTQVKGEDKSIRKEESKEVEDKNLGSREAKVGDKEEGGKIKDVAGNKMGGQSVSDFINKLNELLSSQPRIKAILRDCEITLEGNTVNISSQYKFNITSLSKKEVRDLIFQAMDEVFGKRFNLNFVQVKGEDKKSEVRSQKLEVKKASNEENEDKKLKSKEEKKEEEKKEEDNSLLVENLLL